MSDVRLLEGRTCVITGAGSGVGRAAAVLFAEHGASIVAADVRDEWAAETVRLVAATGRRIVAEQGDVRDAAALRELAERAVSTFGGLDVVVANAGICIPSAWDDTTPEIWTNHLDINVTGVWNTVMATGSEISAVFCAAALVTPRPAFSQ